MLCSGQSTVNSYPGKGADLTGGLSSLLVRSSVRSLFLSLLSVSPELNYYTQSFRAEAPAGGRQAGVTTRENPLTPAWDAFLAPLV